jgi:Mlc titration factor MtfA (ptsG expression regulator)
VRVERPGDRAFSLAAAVMVAVLLPAVGALYAGSLGAMLGGLLGLAGAVALNTTSMRRSEQRRAALASPFPEAWRTLLEQRYDHYDRLPQDWRARFEDDLRLFLSEKRITGVGVEMTDELRLLVAASAVTLSVGWPDYEWDQLTEVLLYPQDFDRDYGFEKAELAGQAHPWGTVIMSVPSLQESVEDPDDGYHVGLHEFAHLIDMERAEYDGIPIGLSPARAEQWVALVRQEMERMRRGSSVMDDYGAESPVEFLAVAVETFFEAPLAMRREHREVYEILAEYFRQDPAAWDDERGLALEA